MDLPKRKHPRLKDYDYSQNGAYFITFCTEHRKQLLGTVLVGRDALVPPQVSLSVFGKIVQKYIEKSGSVYDGVFVDHYAIMPNHVHLLLRMEHTDGGTGASRPTAQSAPLPNMPKTGT